MSFVSQHSGAVLWSVALHVAVVVGLLLGIPWPERQRAAAPAAALIEGVIIDQAAIEREQEQREQAARAERQRVQREERQRREAVEQQRAEQQRVADERRAREQADQRERDRVAAEKREQDRRAQEQREQQEREREATAKREREQAEQRRRQQQAEAELQAQLALEAERNSAAAVGELDQYIRSIENRIKQNWDRPLSARPGIDCLVTVVQLPTGDVVSAKVASCNGDDAVRRSIENAVMNASPLPKPPRPALFERSLNVNFRPDQ